jgi:hypothetical protein
MIEWIVIFLIIFCIIVSNYSQITSEYSISQIKESQISNNLQNIWEEKHPIVISDVRSINIWSSVGLKRTRFWNAQPIWGKYENSPGSRISIPSSLQLTWSEILGISQIESENLIKWFDASPWLFSTRTECHIGPDGLRQTYGWATAVTCTEGEARCILLHNAQKSKMPAGWRGLPWSEATVAHHPLWSQVKNIEIILRPSTVLLIPPHWIFAIEPLDSKKPIWWLRTDLHHPISKWAHRWNEPLGK